MKVKTKKKKIIRAKITKKKFFFFLGGWGPEGRQAGRRRSWSCHLSGGFMVKLCVANSTRYLHAASAESLYNNNKKKKYLMPNYYVGLKLVFMYS